MVGNFREGSIRRLQPRPAPSLFRASAPKGGAGKSGKTLKPSNPEPRAGKPERKPKPAAAKTAAKKSGGKTVDKSPDLTDLLKTFGPAIRFDSAETEDTKAILPPDLLASPDEGQSLRLGQGKLAVIFTLGMKSPPYTLWRHMDLDVDTKKQRRVLSVWDNQGKKPKCILRIEAKFDTSDGQLHLVEVRAADGLNARKLFQWLRRSPFTSFTIGTALYHTMEKKAARETAAVEAAETELAVGISTEKTHKPPNLGVWSEKVVKLAKLQAEEGKQKEALHLITEESKLFNAQKQAAKTSGDLATEKSAREALVRIYEVAIAILDAEIAKTEKAEAKAKIKGVRDPYDKMKRAEAGKIAKLGEAIVKDPDKGVQQQGAGGSGDARPGSGQGSGEVDDFTTTTELPKGPPPETDGLMLGGKSVLEATIAALFERSGALQRIITASKGKVGKEPALAAAEAEKKVVDAVLEWKMPKEGSGAGEIDLEDDKAAGGKKGKLSEAQARLAEIETRLAELERKGKGCSKLEEAELHRLGRERVDLQDEIDDLRA